LDEDDDHAFVDDEPSGDTTQERPAVRAQHDPEPAPGSGGSQPEDLGQREPRGEAVEEDATVMIPMTEPEVDGDATILISSADLPAGTEHLPRQSSPADDAH
jgi:hypothetical protein